MDLRQKIEALDLQHPHNDIYLAYTAEAEVSLAQEPNEPWVMANRTDSLDVWWQILLLPGNEDLIENELYEAKNPSASYLTEPLTTYTLEPDDEGYSFDEDQVASLIAHKENADELFQNCECETIRHDHKRGTVRGTWTMPVSYDAIVGSDQFWDIFHSSKGTWRIWHEDDMGEIQLHPPLYSDED